MQEQTNIKPDLFNMFKTTTDSVGLAVMTYNNRDLLTQCLKSLQTSRSRIKYLIVINDGTPYDNYNYNEYVNVDKVITLPSNKGVGIAKNVAMRELVQSGCEHIFLIENDMTILDSNIFDEYIRTAKKSGIYHLNFGLHQKYNKDQEGKSLPRISLMYDENTGVNLYRHILGAFTYFHRDIIFMVGYHDERYINAMEHVDHTMRIIQKGYHPPFWWFADIYNSDKFIQEVPGTGDKHNSINPRNFKHACEWFKHKHKYIPMEVPDTVEDEVIKKVKQIRYSYGKK